MKEALKRIGISFSISALSGLFVNLLIDVTVNRIEPGFISMTPEYRVLFPTPALAAYVNVVLYGIIGAAFSGMTMIFSARRIGLIIQWAIYFIVTFAVYTSISVILWQLHKYPPAIICSAAGYGITYLIIGIRQYKQLKADIKEINEELSKR